MDVAAAASAMTAAASTAAETSKVSLGALHERGKCIRKYIGWGGMHPNTGTGDHASFPLRTPCFHLFTKARAEQAHQELMTGLRRVEVLQEGNSDELL